MIDDELILKLKEGDVKSFEGLYEKYKSKVYNTAISYVQNPQDAEEITQDVFVEVFRSIEKFKSGSSLSTWIYRITVNRSLDYIRYTKRKKRFGIIASLFSSYERENPPEPSDFIHPGIEAENKETSVILFKSINKLPENQKTAFILSKIENLSYSEIAQVMKISVSSVESLLFRAKQNLRNYLSKYYDEIK